MNKHTLLFLLLLFCSNSFAFKPPPLKDIKNKNLSSLDCLALNLYFESRGESDIANVTIMAVVFNRVADKRYPNDYCDVVFQHKQFSWTSNLREVKDIKRYKSLYSIVENSIIHKAFISSINEGVTHYHSVKIKPYWIKDKNIKYINQVDNHKFYLWKK